MPTDRVGMQGAPANTLGEDLTARARIRNVALAHFAEHGVRATTIRGVAKDAGVSPGLVQHHFGTKAGLRQACDEYVSQQLRQGVKLGVNEQAIAKPEFVADTHRTAPLILRYLARALTDGSPTANALFDQAVALTEEYLAQRSRQEQTDHKPDTRVQAATVTAMKLGVIVLHQHLSRALETDSLAPTGITRVSKAMLDIVSPTFIGEDLVAAARGGLNVNDDMNTPPPTPPAPGTT